MYLIVFTTGKIRFIQFFSLAFLAIVNSFLHGRTKLIPYLCHLAAGLAVGCSGCLNYKIVYI